MTRDDIIRLATRRGVRYAARRDGHADKVCNRIQT
jgi:hypothetical protein